MNVHASRNVCAQVRLLDYCSSIGELAERVNDVKRGHWTNDANFLFFNHTVFDPHENDLVCKTSQKDGVQFESNAM